MGHSKSMFKWNLLKRGIGLALIFIGAIVGIYGILWGMVIGFWFTYFVNARLAGRITGYTLRKQMSELLPILLITLFSCVVSYFVGSILSLHYALTMLIQVLSFIIVYILLSALFKIYAFDIYINIVQEALVSIRNKLNKK
jgi:hypothetical protein